MKPLLISLAVAVLSGLILLVAELLSSPSVSERETERRRVSLRWLGKQLRR